MITLLNKLPNTSDVTFSMEESILVGGGSRLFTQRYAFARPGVIPLHKTTSDTSPDVNLR